MQAQLAAFLQDDGGSLDAAFAFLNDWPGGSDGAGGSVQEAGSSTDDNDSSSASDLPANSSATESSSPPPAKTRAAPRRDRGKSTIDRRKDELKLLQTEAVALEAILQSIAAQKKRSHDDQPRSQSALPPNPDDLGSMEAMLSVWMAPDVPGHSQRVAISTLWKDMAQRHKVLRKASETENARLRRLVAGQRKTIAGIRGMLRRQIRQDRQNQQKVALIPSLGVLSTADDARILEHLRLEVERHSMTSLTALGGWSELLPSSQIRQVSATKTTVMLIERHLMPFHFGEVARVLWEFMRIACVKRETLYQQAVTEKNGTMLIQNHCMEQRFGEQHCTLCGHTAMRPTHDVHQGGFVFAGLSRLLEVNGTPVSGISLKANGVASVAHVDGASPLAQLTVLHQFEIQFSEAAPDEEHHVKKIAHILVNRHPETFREMLLEIEATVLQRQTRPLAS